MAQAPAGSAPQKPAAPQFRAGVELVPVDVSVVDRQGRPVADLKPDEFTLTVDGDVRRIVSAEFVSFAPRKPAVPVTTASRADASDLTDGFTGNDRLQPGRLIVLAIDQKHIQPSSVPGAVAAASRFVKSLSATDQVALVAFPQDGPNIGFTTRHDRIIQALDGVVGRADNPRTTSRLTIGEALEFPGYSDRTRSVSTWGEIVDRICSIETVPRTKEYEICAQALEMDALSLAAYELQSTAQSLDALMAVVERLAEIDGPKTMVLLSEGLVVAGNFVGQESAVSPISELGRAAFRARVSLYVLQIDRAFLDTFSVDGFSARQRKPSVSTMAEDRARSAGLETLAGAARGATFKITATADRAFQRVESESSAYYLLAFEPVTGDRDGKPHQIRVRVRRSGVDVRSRTEFSVSGTAKAAASASARDDVNDLLRSPLLSPGLLLRVGTFVMRDTTTSKLRVLLATDIGKGVTAPATVTMGYSILTDAGDALGGAITEAAVKPFGTGPEACWKHTQAILLDPGAYTVRVAAVDPQGRRGSVEHRVTVGLPRATSAELSDLILLDPAGGDVSGSSPAVSGTITTNAVAMYLEVYTPGPTSTGKPSASYEVSGTPTGAPLFSRTGGVQARPGEQRWIASDTLELPLLPPGDYVARVRFALDGKQVAQAVRVFHLALEMGGPSGAGVSSVGKEAPATSFVPRVPTAFRDAGAFVGRFARESVLSASIVHYFLGRMIEVGGAPSAEPVKAALTHAEVGSFAAVLKDLEGAETGTLAVPFLRGLARLAAGEVEPAIREFQDSVRLSPEFFPATFYIGACFASGGFDRDAAGAWRTALITESDAPIVYDVLVDALIRLRETASAQEVLEEAREKWPDDDLFVPRLAVAHALAGRSAEAVSMLAPYIERHPADHQALFLALRLLFEAHSAGSALRSSEEDRLEIVRYANMYAATDGTNKEIVARWLKFVESRKYEAACDRSPCTAPSGWATLQGCLAASSAQSRRASDTGLRIT